ncbi:MAG TPA: hypothetical protein P5092_16005 [Ruminococcus sp.]|nr:hypothetical protein [Ruminococcus sp.]
MADHYIDVDLGALRDAKNAVFNYQMRRAMLLTELKTTVEQTGRGWRAEDSEAFLIKWNAMFASDGAVTLTTENITAYKNILAAAYSAYRKAQEDSVNQASQIGGW